MYKELTKAELFPYRDGRSVPYENYPAYVKSRIMARSVPISNGCIEYPPTVHPRGLISITLYGKRITVTAARALWMAENKAFDLPSSLHVCHKCDNPRCVNINHLFVGTPFENAADCIKKGRRATKYKPHTRRRVLTDDQVKEIRQSKWKPRFLAEQFGVSVGYISKLKSGKAKVLVQ